MTDHRPGCRGVGDIIDELSALAYEIETQDDAGTAHPYMLVQERVRFYGYDPDYSDYIAWINSDGEADADEAEALDIKHGEGAVQEDWTRVGYVDRWVTVQACLTRRGAAAYLAANGHNHRGPTRVYVESAHRNAEMQRLRAMPGEVLALLAESATERELRAMRREKAALDQVEALKAAHAADVAWAKAEIAGLYAALAREAE